jgi:hypothetical protein
MKLTWCHVYAALLGALGGAALVGIATHWGWTGIGAGAGIGSVVAAGGLALGQRLLAGLMSAPYIP